jgi:hypothetical protein
LLKLAIAFFGILSLFELFFHFTQQLLQHTDNLTSLGSVRVKRGSFLGFQGDLATELILHFLVGEGGEDLQKVSLHLLAVRRFRGGELGDRGLNELKLLRVRVDRRVS